MVLFLHPVLILVHIKERHEHSVVKVFPVCRIFLKDVLVRGVAAIV